jgi:hypothetical protein
MTIKWTEAEDALLRSLWGKTSVRQMVASGTFSARTFKSVAMRAARLGLPAIDKSWTRPEFVVLKNNWGKLSAFELMKLLPGRSRSAIIGAAHRAGLTAGPKDARTKQKLVPPPIRSHSIVPNKSIAKSIGMAAKAPPMPTEPLPKEAAFDPLPGSTPVHIYDLEPHHCRWPTGHWLFCGCEKTDGPYCAAHQQIATRGVVMVKQPQDWN